MLTRAQVEPLIIDIRSTISRDIQREAAQRLLLHDAAQRAEIERLTQQLTEAQSTIQRLRDAWRESWDCSHDPGHTVMNEAMYGPEEEEQS